MQRKSFSFKLLLVLVIETFDEHCPGKWTGRGGPSRKPPRSHDFSLWSFLKDPLHMFPVPNRIEMLKILIRQATWQVDEGMFSRILTELDCSWTRAVVRKEHVYNTCTELENTLLHLEYISHSCLL
jgi:hypothetical protein